MRTRRLRVGLATALVLVLIAGVFVVLRPGGEFKRIHVVGYFANSTGVFVGDDVKILGIPVGKIDQIEAKGTRVKIGFWYDGSQKVPADAKAVVLSPALVPARAIQLTPAYTGGPVMAEGAVIPQDRTAVPVEWDDLRKQFERLTATLEPTQPGGVSTLGALVNTAADNVRGQGLNLRQTVIELAQAFSALGDHSNDIFSSVRNLSIVVSALENSADVIRELNVNLAAATALLSNDADEIGNAVHDVNAVVGDVQQFVATNRETLGTTSDKLASVSTAVVESLDDIKQTLHLFPNTIQNFINVYHPAQAAASGVAVLNSFTSPITFLCGAIQAASRLNAEQSAKLCAQYLAPIVKNRQYNFPPLGFNPIVGATARPNELTYSEDWLRPDYVPPQPAPSAPPPSTALPPDGAPLAAEAHQTNPADGLQGMMIPSGAGS
ncbi:MCE family protein [Mycobacterium sp.]|uniref:MCE family protein n=1 Tax=Mycobacterium sp. TaxID=1785 RepID=UPI002BEC0005|nr:MCE family protein [Mycobacterium sp.]HKP43027.1 MCE family protein [Mycobacterium sp.]